MAELSSETLTFLFTDLEGSTRLWEEHPDAMRTALAHHDGLVRDAVEGHGGQVVKSTGDGALATFRTAHDGVGAAVAAQAALAAATWPDPLELRVRMGLHAGEATRAGRRLVRVRREPSGSGDGGRARRPDPVHCRDRRAGARAGRRLSISGSTACAICSPRCTCSRLKGRACRQRSRRCGRWTRTARTCRTSSARSSAANTSSDRSRTGCGRHELFRSWASVAWEDAPRAPGRLRAVAALSADGVWLCELAQVLNPDDLPDAVAARGGLHAAARRDGGGGSAAVPERKDLLLVLDNCEHLVGAVVVVREHRRPRTRRGVSILATSREALGVRG